MSNEVPMDAVEPLIPDPYTAAASVPTMTEIALRVYTCTDILVGNSTLLQDVGVAYLTVIISTPQGVGSGPAVNEYLFKAWATAPEIVDLLVSQGAVQVEAALEISVVKQDGLKVTVESPSESMAFHTPLDAPRRANEVPRQMRFFYGPPVAWINQEMTYNETLPMILEPGVMTHESGILAEIYGQDSGTTPWLAANNFLTSYVTFDKL